VLPQAPLYLWTYRVKALYKSVIIIIIIIITVGEVEIFVVHTQQNFTTNQLVKNFENRSTFAKVIIKHQGVYFVVTQYTF